MKVKFTLCIKHIKKRYYDNIFLSPHLDDAILSCGGQITQKTYCNKSTLIVTIAAGDSPHNTLSELARKMHTQHKFSNNVVSIRRREDMEACKTVRADHLHWNIPDCICRCLPSTEDYVYRSNAEIFKRIHPVEENLIAELVALMNELPAHDYLFCPLAVGNHVDHQITRIAAESAFGKSLAYYEDLPYAMEKKAVANLIKSRHDWHPVVIPLSLNSLKKKIKAVSKYESQIPALFGDSRLMMKKVISYTESIGGERFWLKK